MYVSGLGNFSANSLSTSWNKKSLEKIEVTKDLYINHAFLFILCLITLSLTTAFQYYNAKQALLHSGIINNYNNHH